MRQPLNLLDAALLAILLLSTLSGLVRGLISELFSLGFLIAGVVLAFAYSHELVPLWRRVLEDRQLIGIAAFLSVVLVTIAIGALISAWFKHLLFPGPLQLIDRVLGGAFGLLRGALLAILLLVALVNVRIEPRLYQRSTLAPTLMKAFRLMLNLVPPQTREKILSFSEHDQQKNQRYRRAI